MEKETEELFIKIINKWAECLQCARHLHVRGVGDTILGTVPLIKEMRDKKLTWDDFYNYVKSKDPKYEFDLENDFFVKSIKRALTNDEYFQTILGKLK